MRKRFVDFDICHQTVQLRKLHSVTLTYFLKVNIFKFYISETVRAVKKNVWETCVDFDICHEMVWFRKLYSMTLTYLLKVNSFKFLYLWNGKSYAQKCVGNICRFWHLPSNDVISKIALDDRMTVIDVNICQQTIPLRDLHRISWTYFLRSNILNCNIL